MAPGGDEQEIGVTDGAPGDQSRPEAEEHLPSGQLVADLVTIIHHGPQCRPVTG